MKKEIDSITRTRRFTGCDRGIMLGRSRGMEKNKISSFEIRLRVV